MSYPPPSPPPRVWDVEVTLNGETKTLQIAEGTSLLDAAEQVRAPCDTRALNPHPGRGLDPIIVSHPSHGPNKQAFDDVPSLCRNGVCTTCAAKVTAGGHGSYLVGTCCAAHTRPDNADRSIVDDSCDPAFATAVRH